ncbi:iron uptake porin [Ancylothrix sp. C2]|nr:iron uptake porin [Ancylothrix sp. D3o]MCT7952780.1 iron uptake porin [Ancylothrix sp. D3o]
MNKILLNTLLVSPAVLGAALAVMGPVSAANTAATPDLGTNQATAQNLPLNVEAESPKVEMALSASQPAIDTSAAKANSLLVTPEQSDLKAVTPASAPAQLAQTPVNSNPAPAPNLLQQINRYSKEGAANNSNGQVTSVSQLSDVQPTDWAFQALQNLVERYNCIAGYPDGTFRGNRAMTRYEFAAGLNACLERITEIIRPNANFVTIEDLAVLNRLLEEFQAELATLRGRVDALEARTRELEENQFSTTTKLVGEAIFVGTDSIGETTDVPAAQQRVRLNLNTSFTGKDLLITRLQVGNATPLDVNGFSREGTQTFNVFGDTGNSVRLDTLEYFFPFNDNIDVVIAANRGQWDDFTPTVNPYMEDFDGGNGSISAFGQRNPIYRLGGGTGIGANIRLGRTNILNIFKPSSLTIGYLAPRGFDPRANEGGGGFFRGDYSALAQLNFAVGNVSLAATYIHSYFRPGNFGFDNGLANGLGTPDNLNTSGFVGTNFANNFAGNPVSANSYGLQASMQLSPRFGLSGWVGMTDVNLLRSDRGFGRGTGRIWNYAVTLAFPDLFKAGNLGGIVLGAQPYMTNFDVAGDNNRYDIDGDNIPWHVEAFYKYQINDNISFTPGVIWLINPNQNLNVGAEDAVIGTLRATFTF